MSSTAERGTPAIRASIWISSSLALPRSGADLSPITGPRVSTRRIPARAAPGRAMTLNVTASRPTLSHGEVELRIGSGKTVNQDVAKVGD